MAKMKAIEAAVWVLEKEGVTQAFGVPGAAINPLYAALRKQGSIGHILARHPAERVSHQLAARVGVGVAQLLVANSENAEFADEVGAALGLGAQFGVILPYARQHELEADRVGVGLMQKADMDPAAALTFWERMSRAGRSENRPPEVLSTHPADDRRIAALRSAVAGLPTRRNAG